MARKKEFAIEKGGAKRLTLSWSGIWKNVTVTLDGAPLGDPIPDFKALKLGRDYALPDGRTLRVQFEQKIGGGGLALSIDGRPLPGAGNDPREAIKAAAVILWVIAGLNLVLAFVLIGLMGRQLEGGDRVLLFAEPVVFAILGYLVWKFQSGTALIIAIVLQIVGGVFIMASLAEGGRVPTFGIVIRVFIVIALIRGYKAIADARRLEKEELVDAFR
ncbi:MAG: hypothetical protein IT385_02845 [Deltaproteobacteria bacterium]|nr:hypothetical protein [Deltaproteobacteria bacterium]